MKPDKRVEEIVGFIYRADKSIYNSPEAKEADLRKFITTTLTQHQQDMMSEVVEKFYQEFGISAEIIDPKADNKFTGKYIRRWNRTPDIKTVARWWEKQAQTIIKSISK